MESLYDPKDLISSPCPVCGSTQHKEEARERNLGIVRCASCQLLYTQPRLRDEGLLAMYAKLNSTPSLWKDYVHKADGVDEKQRPSKNTASKWKARFDKVARRLTQKQPLGRCLDVGAGYSSWMRYLLDRGVAAFGFDISDAVKEGKPQDIQDRIFIGKDLDVLVQAGERFDTITLWDVIEHLPHIKRDLGYVHQLLNPGGQLVIRTPNGSWQLFKYRLFKLLGRKSAAGSAHLSGNGIFMPEQHLVHFSSTLLSRVLTECGFSVTHKVVLDPSEHRSFLSDLAYKLIYLQAHLVHGVTLGRCCSNVGLLFIAEKPS